MQFPSREILLHLFNLQRRNTVLKVLTGWKGRRVTVSVNVKYTTMRQSQEEQRLTHMVEMQDLSGFPYNCYRFQL